MKRLTALLAASLILGTALAQNTVDVGKLIKDKDADMTPVVLGVLDKASRKDVVISFPKGTYHFYPEKAVGKYHAVTNHDNTYKRFAFPLIGCSNVTIEGNGSEFIFHGVIVPVLVEKSKGVTLRNFSIDWEVPFYVQATVIANDPKKPSIDVEFTPFSQLEMDGDRLTFTNNGYRQPGLGQVMVFDPKTRAVAYRASDYLLNKPTKATPLGGMKYRLEGRFGKTPAPVGMIYVFKGMQGENRLAPAIHLSDSENILAENLNIYTSAGMGVIGEKTADITLRKVDVKLREGTDRIVSASADATHFCNCRGQLLIENCLFENMLDDATNVHGTYMRIDRVTGPKTVAAKLLHPQQQDYAFCAKGDSIQFVDSETILPKGGGVVANVRKINEGYMTITFTEELPKGAFKPGDGLENITWYPELTFRNNTVRNNRARSILVSTRNKTVIEGNSLSSMMTSILFEGDLDHWHESGAVRDVLIQNNTFLDNVYGGGRGGSVIWINPHVRQRVADQPYERNIRIVNNTFRTFDSSILNAISTGGLVFKGNTIEPSGSYPPIAPDMPTVKLEDCPGTVIEGNTFKGGTGTISMDDTSKKSAKVSGQKGFK